ncbi:Signal peptidase I [Staphylococcus aureus]|uniref:Signal peptidase I n=1 Tax=Staphylococcus aureus TaxID=1280 RepID=A0A380EFT1_STAAU|nr:Signal peptidase I [Staphylococcus aureus]
MDCSVQILKRGVKIEKEILEWIISIAVAFVILFIVGKFIVTPYTIKVNQWIQL